MRIRSLFYIFIFSLIHTISNAQLTLTIEINHLRSDSGQVLLSLYDENQVQIRGLKSTIKNSKSIFHINNLAPSKYAFKYFHDENSSDQLESNSIGIPQEGFGFSNNAKGFLGPPNFEKWIFEMGKDKTIQCIPKYL